MRLLRARLPGSGRAVFVVLAGLLLVSCADTRPEPEAPLKAVEGEGFSVLMPGGATRDEQTIAIPGGKAKLVSYLTAGTEKAYGVNYMDFPKGTKMDLRGAVQGFASGVKGNLQDDKATTYLGYEARDARVTNVNHASLAGTSTAFVRVIQAKGRLYQMIYIENGPNIASPPANYSGFLDSLVIS